MTNGIFGFAASLWNGLVHMLDVSTSRHQLAELDDATLHDLGISRAQARFEAERAPWDVAQAKDRLATLRPVSARRA